MTWHWFFHPKTILFISKSPVYQGFNRYLTVKPHEIHHIHLKASALGRPSSKLQFEASFELIRDEAFVGHELPTISAISRNHQKSLRLWSQIDLSWRAFEGPLKGLFRGGGCFFVNRESQIVVHHGINGIHARTARRRPWSFQICRPSNGLPRTSVDIFGTCTFW